MKNVLKFFVFLLCMIVLPGYASGSGGEEIRLAIGEKTAYVDGMHLELQTAPLIVEGTTLVPFSFLKDAGVANVSWDGDKKEAVLEKDGVNVTFRIGSDEAIVNGAPVPCGVAPVIEDGTTLVPLRFFSENFNYSVTYQPETKTIHLQKFTPNVPPVADFTISRDTVPQGETVVYEDKSHDPDGDEIVERQWFGNERAFFSPGEYEVTLRVKDSEGAWSEPCTKTVKVTEEVKMDKLTYVLHNPIPGEIVGISHIDVLGLKQIKPMVSPAGGEVLVSNSPETVRREGVLYSDTVSGEARVYYHHANGLPRAFGIFLVAKNNGSEPVEIKVERSGVGGPGSPIAVGRASALRYLDSAAREGDAFSLEPGERLVLNKGDTNTINPGQATHGIYDVEVDGEVDLSVVSATRLERIDYVMGTFLIPGDGMHVRGTYPRNERQMSVEFSGESPARVVVADGNDDRFIHGKDAGKWLQNKGNYGLNYRVAVKSDRRAGVFFNPRGGTFAGAGSWDGEAFYLPNSSILQPQKQAALLGVVEARDEKVFEFIPPAGSSLPINLVIIPF